MPKGNRGKSDPVEYRFHLQMKKSIAKTITAEKYNQVFRQWLKTGKVPKGFRVPAEASEWRNLARTTVNGRKWRTGNNRDAIDTLLERSLPHLNFKIKTPASRGRIRGE